MLDSCRGNLLQFYSLSLVVYWLFIVLLLFFNFKKRKETCVFPLLHLVFSCLLSGVRRSASDTWRLVVEVVMTTATSRTTISGLAAAWVKEMLTRQLTRMTMATNPCRSLTPCRALVGSVGCRA